MCKSLLIVGAGGFGKAVAETALLTGIWQKVSFVDDKWPNITSINNHDIVSNIDGIANIITCYDNVLVAIGNNELRKSLIQFLEKIEAPLCNVFHPDSSVSQSASFGFGNVVMAGAVVGANCVIGNGVILNSNAAIDHDVNLRDFSHLGVGTNIAGGVTVGTGAWLHVGCAVGYNFDIKDWDVVNPGTGLFVK